MLPKPVDPPEVSIDGGRWLKPHQKRLAQLVREFHGGSRYFEILSFNCEQTAPSRIGSKHVDVSVALAGSAFNSKTPDPLYAQSHHDARYCAVETADLIIEGLGRLVLEPTDEALHLK